MECKDPFYWISYFVNCTPAKKKKNSEQISGGYEGLINWKLSRLLKNISFCENVDLT